MAEGVEDKDRIITVLTKEHGLEDPDDRLVEQIIHEARIKVDLMRELSKGEPVDIMEAVRQTCKTVVLLSEHSPWVKMFYEARDLYNGLCPQRSGHFYSKLANKPGLSGRDVQQAFQRKGGMRALERILEDLRIIQGKFGEDPSGKKAFKPVRSGVDELEIVGVSIDGKLTVKGGRTALSQEYCYSTKERAEGRRAELGFS